MGHGLGLAVPYKYGHHRRAFGPTKITLALREIQRSRNLCDGANEALIHNNGKLSSVPSVLSL